MRDAGSIIIKLVPSMLTANRLAPYSSTIILAIGENVSHIISTAMIIGKASENDVGSAC